MEQTNTNKSDSRGELFFQIEFKLPFFDTSNVCVVKYEFLLLFWLLFKTAKWKCKLKCFNVYSHHQHISWNFYSRQHTRKWFFHNNLCVPFHPPFRMNLWFFAIGMLWLSSRLILNHKLNTLASTQFLVSDFCCISI